MWIRDTLPKIVTSVRFILYGYDTTLADSKSFQNDQDLALSLFNEMKAGGWTLSAAKSLVFFAHSLGGVVLKQTFVMLAGSGDIDKSMLERTRGAIFFGVPSQGMQVADICKMLGTQPNKDALVKYISTESQYLPELERQVSGISYVRRMKLFWSYETQTTPTLVVSIIMTHCTLFQKLARKSKDSIRDAARGRFWSRRSLQQEVAVIQSRLQLFKSTRTTPKWSSSLSAATSSRSSRIS